MILKNTPVTSFLKFLFKLKIPAFLLLALLLGGALTQIGGLNVSVDMEDFFVSSDPVLKNGKEFEKLFNNSDFIGVLVESNDVFTKESLELIHRVGNLMRDEIPLGSTLLSLAELEDFPLGGKYLRFEGDNLISTEEDIEEIREIYKTIPSIGGTLFSHNNREAWIILQLSPYGENWDQFSIGEIASDLLASIDSGEIRLTATGVPVYAYRKQTEMVGDLIRVLIFGSIAALLLSLIILRSFRGVSGAIFIIATSVLIVFGFQGLRHTTIDSAFISVPILLTMGVSIGYTVHITRFYQMYLYKTGKRKDAVLYAVQESGKPIIFTAFTTIAALLSFTFVEIRPIQWVGFTSALSIGAVCVLTLIFYPLLLSLGKDQKPKGEKKSVARFEPIMEKTAELVTSKKLLISLVFFLSLVISFFGLIKLEIDFNGVKMMGNRLRHMKDQIHVSQSEIASAETLELVIKLKPGQFKTNTGLKKLEELETNLLYLPLIKDTHSLAKAVKEFNYLRHGRDISTLHIPEKESLTRGLLLYYERLAGDAIRPWVDENYESARIFIELKNFSSREIEQLIDSVDSLVKSIFSEDINFFMSGSSFQMAVMNQYITRGLVRSILTASAMIALLLIILFRSIKFGLIAMIPNIYPIIVCGAIMGYAGIPMEFVTMTIAPMIMGLAVDDTIHFISHIRKDMKITGNPRMSIAFAFRNVGTAITETTVILCLTFLVFLVSDVNSIRNMGILSAAGMASAYLADIFITPLLIDFLYKRKNK